MRCHSFPQAAVSVEQHFTSNYDLTDYTCYLWTQQLSVGLAYDLHF